MRNVLLVGGVALLSACGGGGDEAAPIPTTTLASKADAIREVGNAAGLAAAYDSGSTSAAPTVSLAPAFARSATLKGLRLNGPARFRSAGSGAGKQPAATTEPCDSGSSTYDYGSKSRAFRYFQTSQTVNWATEQDSSCRSTYYFNDGTSVTFIANGFEEFGQAASEYIYQLLGNNGPFSYSIIEKDVQGATTFAGEFRLEGLDETRQTQSLYDDRLSITASGSISVPANVTFSETLGGANPFRLTATPAGALTIDGDFYYSTSIPSCPGGAETFETLQPITTDANGYPNGGTLKVTSGSAWVTIAFQADGSANLTFSNGGSATMSAAEVQSSVDSPSCEPPQPE